MTDDEILRLIESSDGGTGKRKTQSKRASLYSELQDEIAKFEQSKAPTQPITAPATPPPQPQAQQSPTPQEPERASPEIDSPSGAAAFGLGAARGLSLNAIDRLVGIGTDIGERLAAAVHDTAPADPQAGVKAREEYLRNEEIAKKSHPWLYLGGDVLGGAITGTGIGASATAVKVGQHVIPKAVTAVAAPGFFSGSMAVKEDDIDKQLLGGAIGAAVGVAADSALGKLAKKVIGESPEKMGRSLVKDVVTTESGASATDSAARRVVRLKDAVIKELKDDKELASLTRSDARGAIDKIDDKMVELNAQRRALYEQANDTSMATALAVRRRLAQEIERAPTSQKREVATTMLDEFDNFYLPRWKKNKSLVRQGQGPAQIKNEALREWVTHAQTAAARTMGALNETERKQLKDYAADIATDILDKQLKKIGAVAPAIESEIRRYNKRASALLTMQEALNQRALKEERAYTGLAQRMGRSADWLLAGSSGFTAMINKPEVASWLLSALAAKKYGPKIPGMVNDKMLVPIADAISEGAPWAKVAEAAMERGVPQSIARTLYDMTSKRVRSSDESEQ